MEAFPHTYIFIGRSGCGKGTQAKLLQEYLKKTNSNRGIYYLETGARFREFIKGKSFSSRLANTIYLENRRQPDFLAVWMWSHLFVDEFTGIEHLMIDGTPRSLPEARILDTALEFYERKHVNIIYIHVGREWSRRRLTERGRMDDRTAEAIDKRLQWFDSDVLPAVDYYRSHPIHNFIEVNGEQGIETVHQEIVDRLR